jgi:hypothetical protein
MYREFARHPDFAVLAAQEAQTGRGDEQTSPAGPQLKQDMLASHPLERAKASARDAAASSVAEAAAAQPVGPSGRRPLGGIPAGDERLLGLHRRQQVYALSLVTHGLYISKVLPSHK